MVVIVRVLLLDRMSIEVQMVVTEQSPCLVIICEILMEPMGVVGLEILHFGNVILMQVGLGLVA